MKLKLFGTVVGMILLSCPITAKDIVHTKWVDFGRISNETTVVGIVKGYDTIQYKLKVKANQTMHVNMETNKVKFNIFQPNKSPMDGAIFMGKTEGSSFVGKLKKNGVYTIEVYLVDDEAKKDKKIIYTVDIGLK